MKISCDIIKDLLPLYHDGVCSDDSRKLIEDHLTDCDQCKAELQLMHNEFSMKHTKKNLEDAEAVKKLSKRWKKSMTTSLLKGIVVTIITIGVLALILYGLMDIRIVPKPL